MKLNFVVLENAAKVLILFVNAGLEVGVGCALFVMSVMGLSEQNFIRCIMSLSLGGDQFKIQLPTSSLNGHE
jgi:hypothetical protein